MMVDHLNWNGNATIVGCDAAGRILNPSSVQPLAEAVRIVLKLPPAVAARTRILVNVDTVDPIAWLDADAIQALALRDDFPVMPTSARRSAAGLFSGDDE